MQRYLEFVTFGARGLQGKPGYAKLPEHTHASFSGETVRRITKAAVGGLAGCALVLGGTQAASGALVEKNWFRDKLTDLLTLDGPFDSAKAKLTVAERTNGSTTFRIRVRGIKPSSVPPEGGSYGAHLHTGQCEKGDFGTPGVPGTSGVKAGPHYNHDKAKDPLAQARISPETEVWFDLEPDDLGVAEDETTVPFVPVDSDPAYLPGVMSVVIHVKATNADDGKAGDRQACLPLDVRDVFPITSEN